MLKYARQRLGELRDKSFSLPVNELDPTKEMSLESYTVFEILRYSLTQFVEQSVHSISFNDFKVGMAVQRQLLRQQPQPPHCPSPA